MSQEYESVELRRNFPEGQEEDGKKWAIGYVIIRTVMLVQERPCICSLTGLKDPIDSQPLQ